MITYNWFITCCVLPRTSEPMKQFRQIGLQGLVYLVPCVATGCSIYLYSSIVARYFDSNPDPLLPIFIAVKPLPNGPQLLQPLKNTRGSSNPVDLGAEPDDEANVETLALRAAQMNYLFGTSPYGVMAQANWTVKVFMELTDGPNPYFEAANSVGYIFAYRLYGVLFVILLLLSVAALRKQYVTKRLLTWPTYVIFIEGFVGSVFRGLRCFTGQYFWNGNTPIDVGNWISDNAETPYTVSTTWVTALVWLRIVYGRPLSKIANIVFHCFTAAGAIAIVAFAQTVGLWYPMLPWWKHNPFGTSQGLRDGANNPPLIINLCLVGVFALASVYAVFMIFRASKGAGGGATTGTKTLKIMLKYILMQIVGIVLATIAGFIFNFSISPADHYPIEYSLVYSGHFKELGGLLSGYGQVGACFSSSSSSSSKA